MTSSKRISALALLALLSACEVRVDKDGDRDAAAQTAETSVEARSEEGSVSIKAPGFDMKVNIPDGVAKLATVDSDSAILYPGSRLSGMHVEASSKGGGDRSGVELRFTSADAPATVAAWYRDPARAPDFTVASASREGDTIVIGGVDKDDGDPFMLRISPREGGGSDARLNLSDRD